MNKEREINVLINDLNNLDDDQRRNIVIIIIMSIIIVGILMITFLVLIWTNAFRKPKDKIDEIIDSKDLGAYITISSTREDALKMYLAEIQEVLYSGDADAVFKLFSKDFTSYYGYNKDTLYKYLKDRGIIGNKFTANEYSYARYDDLSSNVFVVTIENKSNRNKIFIIEESPRKYVLSMDNYIGKTHKPIEKIQDGIKVTINYIEEFANFSRYSISISNMLQNSIIINKQNEYEVVYAIDNVRNKEVRSERTWFAGDKITVEKGKTISGYGEFRCDNLSGGSIDSIKIKNIYNTVTMEDVQIDISTK